MDKIKYTEIRAVKTTEQYDMTKCGYIIKCLAAENTARHYLYYGSEPQRDVFEVKKKPELITKEVKVRISTIWWTI